MKTLILTLEYPPQIGGIASYVIGIAEPMPAHDVVVYAPNQTGDATYDERHAWKVYRENPFTNFMWPRWIKILFSVQSIARQEKVDAVHVHHVLPLGYAAVFIKKFSSIPYTIFLHGSDFQFAAKSAPKLKKFRWLCRGAERMVVNSEFSKRRLEEMIGDSAKVLVLYPCPNENFVTFNPVPAEQAKLRSTLALDGKKVILTVARLVDRKGHMLLARLLPQIVQRVPNTVWVIIGEGAEEKELVEYLQKNNLHSIVRFLRPMDTAHLPPYYHIADIFVLLTHKDEDGVEEAWGTAFLEAAACGIPAIAGRSGGVAEAVLDGVTGMVVDTHQEDAVVNAIVDLLQNPEKAKQLGRQGRERVMGEFRWEKQVKKLES